MRIFLILLLMCGVASAEVNEKYSYRQFMDKDLLKVDVKELNDTTIVGSCFAQQPKYSADALGLTPPESYEDIFPDGLKGVIFDKCNLDNVLIKAGMTVLPTCSNRRLRTMNDWEDWTLDSENKPVEPLSKDAWVKANKSIDPSDIPNVKWTAEERKQFEKDINDADNLISN